MYQWFQVKNYRGLENVRLDDFERVNLISGMNNVGKTNLLEAIFIHSGVYNPGLLMTIRALRGLDRLKIERGSWSESPFAPWFYQKNTDVDIEFAGQDAATGYRETKLRIVSDLSEIPQVPQYADEVSEESDNGARHPGIASSAETVQALRLESHVSESTKKHYLVLTLNRVHIVPFPASPPFQTNITSSRGVSDPEAEFYTNLVKKGTEGVVYRILNIVEPRLQNIFLLTEADQTRLWGRLDFGPLPLLDMGEGMVRLANLAIRIANTPNGVVLVDEIENGLHYSVLPQIWRFINQLSREFNTQVFATTHSRECVRAAHNAFREGEYDFRLYRLQRTPEDVVEAVMYDKDTLELALESGFEVR